MTRPGIDLASPRGTGRRSGERSQLKLFTREEILQMHCLLSNLLEPEIYLALCVLKFISLACLMHSLVS